MDESTTPPRPRRPRLTLGAPVLLAAVALLAPPLSAQTGKGIGGDGIGGRGIGRDESPPRTPLNGKKWIPAHYAVKLDDLIADPQKYINRANRGKLLVITGTIFEPERKRNGWVADYKGHRIVFNDDTWSYYQRAQKVRVQPVMKTRIHKTRGGYSYHFTRGYLPQDSPPRR